MKRTLIISLIAISLVVTGCSLQYHFIIGNSTDQAVLIKYSLDQVGGENSLFEAKGEIYQSAIDYTPDWEHPILYRDRNNADDAIWIELGPKSTFVFGTVSNEKYDPSSLSTTSGKQFNLQQMTFSVNGVDYFIDSSNFHDFFLEDGGYFKYIIQP